jgi:hypothetical protein
MMILANTHLGAPVGGELLDTNAPGDEEDVDGSPCPVVEGCFGLVDGLPGLLLWLALE